MRFIILLLLLSIELPASFGQWHSLKVIVSNIESSSGHIRMAVYASVQHFPTETVYRGHEMRVDGAGFVEITIDSLRNDTYALSVYHDVNDNGRLDLNKLGLPKEPTGFSNNARSIFGPPSFVKASFQIPHKSGAITIMMR